MAVIEIRSHTNSAHEQIPEMCWFAIAINLHPGCYTCCLGPAAATPQHRHRYFTKRVPLRSLP